MILIKSVEYEEVEGDEVLHCTLEHDHEVTMLGGVPHFIVKADNPSGFTFKTEAVKGQRFAAGRGDDAVLGFTEKAKKVLGVVLRQAKMDRSLCERMIAREKGDRNAYREMRMERHDAVRKAEHLDAKWRLAELNLEALKQSSFWQRLKFLFLGEKMFKKGGV